MIGYLTTKQAAVQTGKSVNRIQQMCLRGVVTKPLAEKAGSNWWLLPEAIPFIKALKDGRGRPRKINSSDTPI